MYTYFQYFMKKRFIGSLLLVNLVIFSSVFAAGVTTTKLSNASTTTSQTDTKKTPIKGLVILNDYFAHDENKIYTLNDTKTGWDILPAADYDTFRVMLGWFAQDKNDIFYWDTILEPVDKTSFVVISGTHGYASDDVHIFGPQGVIEWADPETFKLYTGRYSADAGNVYYMGKKIDADSATFHVLNNGLYAVDAEKVFYDGKVLKGVPVAGFFVKWERAFAADGHVFFEWRVEKWEPLSDDDVEPLSTEGSIVDEADTLLTSYTTLFQKLFSEQSFLAPYKTFLSLEWPLLSFFWLVIVSIFSALFVFFAARNDEPVSWIKTVIKTLIALLVWGGIYWWVSHWLSLLVSGIVAGIVGMIAFLSLCNVGGRLKTLFVAILSCIAFGFFVSVALIILRAIGSTPHTILDIMARDTFQLWFIFGSVGLFIGTWLLRTQLKLSVISAVLSGIVSTLLSLLVLAFIYWLWPLSLTLGTIAFTLLFGSFTWILSFRWSTTLLLMSIRVLRVTILMWIIVYLAVFLIV